MISHVATSVNFFLNKFLHVQIFFNNALVQRNLWYPKIFSTRDGWKKSWKSKNLFNKGTVISYVAIGVNFFLNKSLHVQKSFQQCPCWKKSWISKNLFNKGGLKEILDIQKSFQQGKALVFTCVHFFLNKCKFLLEQIFTRPKIFSTVISYVAISINFFLNKFLHVQKSFQQCPCWKKSWISKNHFNKGKH